MKIIIIVFSLLAIFMMSMSLLTSDIKDRTDQVKTKIEKWYIEDKSLMLELLLYNQDPLFFSKRLNCKTYDKDKKELRFLEKNIEAELKKPSTITVDMGRVKGKVKYIDCNFIKD